MAFRAHRRLVPRVRASFVMGFFPADTSARDALREPGAEVVCDLAERLEHRMISHAAYAVEPRAVRETEHERRFIGRALAPEVAYQVGSVPVRDAALTTAREPTLPARAKRASLAATPMSLLGAG